MLLLSHHSFQIHGFPCLAWLQATFQAATGQPPRRRAARWQACRRPATCCSREGCAPSSATPGIQVEAGRAAFMLYLLSMNLNLLSILS